MGLGGCNSDWDYEACRLSWVPIGFGRKTLLDCRIFCDCSRIAEAATCSYTMSLCLPFPRHHSRGVERGHSAGGLLLLIFTRIAGLPDPLEPIHVFGISLILPCCKMARAHHFTSTSTVDDWFVLLFLHWLP